VAQFIPLSYIQMCVMLARAGGTVEIQTQSNIRQQYVFN
jgi:hypothetical protein